MGVQRGYSYIFVDVYSSIGNLVYQIWCIYIHFLTPITYCVVTYIFQCKAFGNAQKNRDGLELIKIDNIVLPPSPYFSDKFMPLLNNNNDTLTSLQLSNTDLGSEEIKCIAKFIKKNKTLSTLDLSGNKTDNVAAAKSLALAMKKHPELDFVNLSKCNLGGKITVPRQENTPAHEVEGSVDVLAALLTGCKKLETLLLDNNGISSEKGVSLVAKFLANNKALTTVSLEGNELQGKVFDQAITKNTELRQLNMGRNKMAVPAFLKDGNINLTCIDLSQANGSYNGVSRYGYASRGSMGIAGAKVIAKYLKGNPAVTDLNLSWNRLPSKAAGALASALKKNTVLQHLNLSGNNFNDKSVPSFVACLKKNSTLLTLDLCYNSIRVETGRKELLRGAFCDTSDGLQSIATSNHTCALTMVEGTFKNDVTKEIETRNINLLDSEGMKIRYKVVMALFTFNPDLFHPRTFDEVPLELMPRLLELVQCEVGYGGFGVGVSKVTRKRRADGFNPTLRRLYQVVTEWNTPELVSVSIVFGFVYVIIRLPFYTSSLCLAARTWQIEEEEEKDYPQTQTQVWRRGC